MDIAVYVAKVEKLFADTNTELHRQWSQDIPIELLHAQILATVEPEYQDFSNVWESLDDYNRTTNNLLEKLSTIERRLQISMAAESNAFVPHASTTRSQSEVLKTTSTQAAG
jgi:hypothetical protein